MGGKSGLGLWNKSYANAEVTCSESELAIVQERINDRG